MAGVQQWGRQPFQIMSIAAELEAASVCVPRVRYTPLFLFKCSQQAMRPSYDYDMRCMTLESCLPFSIKGVCRAPSNDMLACSMCHVDGIVKAENVCETCRFH